MFANTSMFGYQSSNPIDCAAYDMMVLKDMGILDPPDKTHDEGDEAAPLPGRWF